MTVFGSGHRRAAGASPPGRCRERAAREPSAGFSARRPGNHTYKRARQFLSGGNHRRCRGRMNGNFRPGREQSQFRGKDPSHRRRIDQDVWAIYYRQGHTRQATRTPGGELNPLPHGTLNNDAYHMRHVALTRHASFSAHRKNPLCINAFGGQSVRKSRRKGFAGLVVGRRSFGEYIYSDGTKKSSDRVF